MSYFYHFTSMHGAAEIFRTGRVLPGKASIGGRSIVDGYAVCLTTDDMPLGHGLPDGSELSALDAKYLGRCRFSDGKYYSIDHTVIRLRILIKEGGDDLLYVPDLFVGAEVDLYGLELAGYFPCSSPGNIKKEALLSVDERLRSGGLQGKSNTWWYYRKEIPIDWIVEVSVNSGFYKYISASPSEFIGFIGGF